MVHDVDSRSMVLGGGSRRHTHHRIPGSNHDVDARSLVLIDSGDQKKIGSGAELPARIYSDVRTWKSCVRQTPEKLPGQGTGSSDGEGRL